MMKSDKHEQVFKNRLLIHQTLGAAFFFLFFIVMVIPTLIVFAAGTNLTSFNGFSQNTKPKLAQNGHVAKQNPLLTLGWVSENQTMAKQLADYRHLNIVSPALISISDQYDLSINNDSATIHTIQQQGKKIWTRLIMQTDTKSNVHDFLSNKRKTAEMVQNIHQTVLSNHWDGINLDIENIDYADRNAFSQFIENLSQELKKSKIVLSIDLAPDPGGNNQLGSFDHQVIGKYCDYIIFMGYDQHWSTDPIPGPVTSLSWIRNNLQEFIQTGIPAEKLLIGLPAYTRIWQQNQQGDIIRDPALPIPYIENEMDQNQRNWTWDAALGEYYTSYTVNNVQYKIWLPTVKSFDIYLGLISEFHLAGSAVWNLNQMNADYWNQLYDKQFAKK